MGGGEDSLLDLLIVVANLSVLAPARLVLALSAVVASICGLVLHLEDVVEATRVSLGANLLGGRLLDSLRSTEVIDIGVLLIQLILELFNTLHSCVFGLACFFLTS